MANTIDVEAKRNINLAVDVDKHRRRLIKADGNVSVQFVAPTITTFEKYRYFLLRNSISKTLDEKYKFRPDYLAHKEYGTVVLWPLLLFINNIASIEEFDLDSVLVPDYSAVVRMCRFNELNSEPINLDDQSKEPSRKEKIVLYSNTIAPNLIDQTTKTNSLTQQPEDPVFYIRRRIVLTQVDILNESVDLAYIPIIESVTLKIEGENFGPIYNSHYSIVERPDGQIRRLSWSNANNSEGSGLSGIVTTGTVLEIQYVQDETA